MLEIIIFGLVFLVICAYKHAQDPSTFTDREAEYHAYLEDDYDF